MVYYYQTKIVLEPLINYTDVNSFVKEVFSYLYALYKINNIEEKNNHIFVDYTFQAGAKINMFPETFKEIVGKKVELKDFELKEIAILRKSYLGYIAECRLKGKEPLSEEEFNKKYFNEENYEL